MKLLNLGCGNRYHKLWTNIDFLSYDENILAHNLLKGIPFADNAFDVVYHAHVLEHFTKVDGKCFLLECLRVLKPNGIIRIAVPDLENITREYLKNLELALQGNENAANNYEWIKLELYDQVVRNESGGDMAKYIFQKDIPNENYIYERIGEEGRNLRKSYLQSLEQLNSPKDIPIINSKIKTYSIKSFFNKIKSGFREVFFQKQIQQFELLHKETAIGKFRLGGEIHQWMYDRFQSY
jgi:predicted SAM-dependent methyltransferase